MFEVKSMVQALLTVTLVSGSASFSWGGPQIAVGEKFPELALPSLDDGAPLSVASFRGQTVVLHIWASW